MRPVAIYIGVAVLLAAVLFGVLRTDSTGLFHRGSRPSAHADRAPAGLAPARAAAPVAAADAERAIDAALAGSELKAENERLRSANRDLQNRLVAVLNWILANFRGKYPLPETYMSKLQVAAVTDDFTVHPELAELLKVTPGEEQKINDALAYARDYLSKIEAAIIEITNPRPDKVILHIPTFSEDGKLLQEDLYTALEITLGENRFDRLLDVSETGLKSSFAQFGEASRTMVFELVYGDENEMPQLKIKDGWVMEIGPNTRAVTATESVVTNLPVKYSAYLTWLPDYVAVYSRN